jgi:antitoxin component YwqK of YwqJK toxin-antitoxin module
LFNDHALTGLQGGKILRKRERWEGKVTLFHNQHGVYWASYKSIMKPTLLLIFAVLFALALSAQQQPPYTKKYFVSKDDTAEFKRIIPAKDGFTRTYILAPPQINDVDDNNSTHVKGGSRALICFEGNMKNGKRNGVFTGYLIDSFDHTRRFKIWEQTYLNDKLHGTWTTYNLKGTRVQTDEFVQDSLQGISRFYWIDGKLLMKEVETIDGKRKFIEREFYKNGKVEHETTFINNQPNGEARAYYESGSIKERVIFKNGKFNDLRTYYYENGKPWLETLFKEGKPWTIIANYDSKGNKRNAGTLKDGNGTIIFYDDDTTIRETITYKNGEKQ